MRKKKYVVAPLLPKNPLNIYKLRHPSVTWEQISAKTGVPKQTLMGLIRKTPAEMMYIQLGSYYRIRKHLGVDLLSTLLYSAERARTRKGIVLNEGLKQ